MLNLSFCLCEFCFCIPPLVSFDLQPSLGSSRNAPPPPSLGRGITQHSSPRRRGEGALRDDPQNRCEGDYTNLLRISFLKVNVIFLREGGRGGGRQLAFARSTLVDQANQVIQNLVTDTNSC